MSELVGYYIFGRPRASEGVFIAPLLADKVPSKLRDNDVLAFMAICRRQNADLVGTVRSRIENGELHYYHAFFSNPPNEADRMLKMEALIRIIVQDRNPQNPQRELERLCEDVKVLEELK